MSFFNKNKNTRGLSKQDEKLFYQFIKPHLQNGEEIKDFVANAVNRTNYGLSSIPSTFVAATNKRVIHFHQLGVMKSKIKSFPYEQIKNIEMESGPLFSKIDFQGTHNDFSIEKISTSQARSFVEFVENRRNE